MHCMSTISVELRRGDIYRRGNVTDLPEDGGDR